MNDKIYIHNGHTALLLSWLSSESYIKEVNEYGETVYGFERTDRLAYTIAVVMKKY